MAVRHKAPQFGIWVDLVAGSIGDPVRRLRFLQATAPLSSAPAKRRRVGGKALALLLMAVVAAPVSFFLMHAAARVAPPAPPPAISFSPGALPAPPANVWQVEDDGSFETYSNGLRIDHTLAVSHHRRSYLAFPADGVGPARQRTEPAGIVFHGTESQQVPFEATQNDTLKRIGESLLDYIRRRRCYHFLIDRFGRVYRVVAESDSANHAGYSVWADDQWLYVNLNESFLGVSFEAQTGPEHADVEITAAQQRSAVMLAEMLRVRYHIPAGNCVTHAQVSVNPSNMRAGYHVDWASHFPFQQLGLPDNYGIALPSVWAFGFEVDAALLGGATEISRGATLAARILNARAAAAGLRPAEYRKRLQQQYRQRLAAMRQARPEAPE